MQVDDQEEAPPAEDDEAEDRAADPEEGFGDHGDPDGIVASDNLEEAANADEEGWDDGEGGEGDAEEGWAEDGEEAEEGAEEEWDDDGNGDGTEEGWEEGGDDEEGWDDEDAKK